MQFILLLIVFLQFSINAFSIENELPIDISSDSLVVNQKENNATFKGDVKIKHGDIKLGSEVLDVHYSNTGGEDIKKIVAIENVVIAHGESVATGDKAIYTPKLGHVLLTGDVVLTRDGGILKGENLVYNLKTGHMSLANPSENGRVKATFSIKRDR